MKKKRFTEHQIIKILKEAEAGVPIQDLCRQHGFSKSSFYKWRAKYSGMDASVYRFKGFGHFVMETSTTRIDYTPAI
ncbi:MAG: transposase [Anaerolineae bacterium]|jgi:putative transposase|nr:transposase [Anaerolineae bacterium]